MTVSWSKEFNPSPIIQRLQESRITDGRGHLTFEGFSHKECIAFLLHTLLFPNGIPENERRRILNQATMTLRDDSSLTASTLLEAINRLTDQYLQLPSQSYVLATSISLSQFSDLPSYSDRQVIVRFTRQPPHQFLRERKAIAGRIHQALFTDPPTHYLYVLARVSARSLHEATDSALEAIDLQRGIWNWFYNRRHFTRMSFGSQDPVNKILLGPIHTLHHPRGKLATDTFWFEPTYRAPVTEHYLENDKENIAKFSKSVRKALHKTKYRTDIEEAIIRYVRALDDRDWHAAFLKLWGVLERLTSKTRDETYAAAAKRAAFIFADREYYGQVMKVLVYHRNQVVHASASTEEIETYLYQLKNIVEALFEFHLWNRFQFASLTQACEFLDLPTEQDALATRSKIARFALEYRGFRPSKRRRTGKYEA